MGSHFDEFVALKNKAAFQQLWPRAIDDGDGLYSIFRRRTGRWLLLFNTVADSPPIGGGDFAHLQFLTKMQSEKVDYDVSFSIDFENLLQELRKAVDRPIEAEKRLWTPQLWTAPAQELSRKALAGATGQLLSALRSETKSLDDLTWSQLEELVAEVLQRSGLEIHIVGQRPQGGRDILARGELIPGQEPIEIAVEVKHKALVGRPEVQAALWQNRNYPALLFATSGRFTAGVLAERALPENRMRLFLKDGEALGDLIRDQFDRSLY